MKIKHWQGYGNVDASIILRARLRNQNGQIVKAIKVRITGTHECGFQMNSDKTYIHRWLKRLTKIEEEDIDYITYTEGQDGLYGIYTFYLKGEK
jgi:hypothetical protein